MVLSIIIQALDVASPPIENVIPDLFVVGLVFLIPVIAAVIILAVMKKKRKKSDQADPDENISRQEDETGD